MWVLCVCIGYRSWGTSSHEPQTWNPHRLVAGTHGLIHSCNFHKWKTMDVVTISLWGLVAQGIACNFMTSTQFKKLIDPVIFELMFTYYHVCNLILTKLFMIIIYNLLWLQKIIPNQERYFLCNNKKYISLPKWNVLCLVRLRKEWLH